MRTLEANQSQVCLLKANLGAGAPGERVAAQKPRREEGPAQGPTPPRHPLALHINGPGAVPRHRAAGLLLALPPLSGLW